MIDVTTFQFYQGDKQIADGWVKLLERYGPDIVRMSLETNPNAPAGGVMIGPTEVTKGFAQEWLTHKLADRSREERAAKDKQLFWTRAATISGFAAALGTAANAMASVARLVAGG